MSAIAESPLVQAAPTPLAARAVAAGALCASAASLAAGLDPLALTAAVGGLASIAVGRRHAQGATRTSALDLVRQISARSAAAERLDGAVTVALDGLVTCSQAHAAVVVVRRAASGLCDVYSWADGQMVREELLWQDDLARASRSGGGHTPPPMPPRIGRPRRWVQRPLTGRGDMCGSIILVDPGADRLDWLESAISIVADHLGAAIVGERFSERLERGFFATIEALIGALEAKDPYTAGHSARVAAYSMAIANELNLSADLLPDLHAGAVLHDIGKIGVGDSVLLKPGRLSDAEFDQIKDHPRRGARIIDAFNRSPAVLAVVFHHHERYDGRGYPAGLRGVDIPLVARIVNVADAYDAMTTNRPYGSTRSPDEAMAELRRGAGTQFDPRVVEALVLARAHGRI